LARASVIDTVDAVETALREGLRASRRRPFVLGLCGAQGSGKSTLAAALATRLRAEGIGCVTLSLDDLYKTRAARQQMARKIHPLFATRGVPGTHDLALAFTLLDALEHRRAGRVPRFDKACDDRFPEQEWDDAPADTQVLILEGWCIGARPQEEAALDAPINALERDDDPDGVWRRYANAALAGDYQRLFARIDLLVLLAAPGFQVVLDWRMEQEKELRAEGRGGMTDEDIARFIQHYERLTRHILAEMPAYAGLVIALNPDRSPRMIDKSCSLRAPVR
jgi:D-glycerate 3-kinase